MPARIVIVVQRVRLITPFGALHSWSSLLLPPATCRFVELTKQDKDRLICDIRDAQQKIAEEVRMSQAVVHFQSDEAFTQVRGVGGGDPRTCGVFRK
jgi:hypothetical protein